MYLVYGYRNNFWGASQINDFYVIDVHNFSFLIVRWKDSKNHILEQLRFFFYPK